ncbi:hypothetical protein ENTCAN_08214 [Enterobacter cancerogenus ATCC 35316]|nr:hypothetical protein ENTCAN_08214 [Enterobacter cancerogenus ATCC 35316]
MPGGASLTGPTMQYFCRPGKAQPPPGLFIAQVLIPLRLSSSAAATCRRWAA